MKRVSLVFGTHNTLPIGDLESTYERAYERAYKPFLTVLNRHPSLNAVLHYSGILLEWFDRIHPEFLMLLSDMVRRKQVELLTGGYYEPVLALIPNPDRLGQIEKLTNFLRGNFGKRSRGSWLADRIWEPSLASTLNTGGVEYTFLTESHLQAAGLEGDDLHYPYLTEDQGKAVVVYPLSLSFGKMLGTTEPEELVEALKKQADTDGGKVISIIEDGERLGYWDEGTYRVLYEEKWLERFFSLLEGEPLIRSIIPAQQLKDIAPKAKMYFPPTTYGQVMDWVPSNSDDGASRRKSGADRSGSFRQFLTRYPESNLLYSRMMYTSLLVNQIRGDKYRKKTAREEIWKGQCSVPYRHGGCGGIYTSRLRKKAYQAFIEAEKIIRGDGATFTPSINSVDFDLDGHKEFLHQGPNLNVFVHPCGGSIFELDFLPASWNYGDSLSRRPEDYHRPEDRSYDRYPRRIFVDHFFSPDLALESFQKAEHEERGNFFFGEYELGNLDREERELTLVRVGQVDETEVVVTKRYRFKKSTIYLQYTIENRGSGSKDFHFGSEINLAFGSGVAEALRIQVEEKTKTKEIGLEPVTIEETSSLDLRDMDNQVLIRLKGDREFALWSLPLETVYRTAQAWEMAYQATCLVPRWKMTIAAGEQWQVELALNITRQ